MKVVRQSNESGEANKLITLNLLGALQARLYECDSTSATEVRKQQTKHRSWKPLWKRHWWLCMSGWANSTQICDSVLSKVGELLISLKLWDPICNSPAESVDKIAHRIVNEAEDFLPNWILWRIHLLVEGPLIPSSFCDLLLFNMQEVKKKLILKEDWRGTTSNGGAGIIGNEWKQIYAWKHNAAPEEAGCPDALWEKFDNFSVSRPFFEIRP
jgi:hypothetical protein